MKRGFVSTRRGGLAAVLVAMLAMAAPAADRRPYVFDLSHSQLNFVAEALLVTAHGFFEKFEADIQVDPENLENSTLTFTIDAASINTRNERRDNHLRSPDFFDVANHPQIKFASTKVIKADDKNLVVVGDLTIRGTAKQVQVPVRIVFLREGDARFKGEFRINRQDFGIKFNSRMNPIEDEVLVQFDFHLNDQQALQQRRQQQQQKAPPKQPPQS
jgi:polyisoprenoid-binding protein YceI